jgi:hypothetical protein
MNDYPTIEQPQSLHAPSTHNAPETKAQGSRKCRDYFEYRNIPQEGNTIAEPEIDYPDFEKDRVEQPVILHKEPVSAPMPEHSNFFSGINAQPNESIARISVIPEYIETTPQIVKRTYYIPSGPRESLQPQVYYFQNTSPPESFFHENKPVQIQHALQTRASYTPIQVRTSHTPSQIRASHTPVHVHANGIDPTLDIQRKFEVINGLNRIDSEIKALAIEHKNQSILNETLNNQSHLQVEEKVKHLNRMLAMKNDLAKYQIDLETIPVIDHNEKHSLKNRIEEMKVNVEYQMNQKKISFTQNLPGNNSMMKMSESIVSMTGNVQPRMSYTPHCLNQETTSRIISRSVNVNRANNPGLKPVQFIDHNGLRTSNIRQSITVNDPLPVVNDVPARKVYAQNVEKYTHRPPSIERLHVDPVPLQLIQPAPQVVRYSYIPNQVLAETKFVHEVIKPEAQLLINQPKVILPLSKIQESINENYESHVQKSNTVIQRFSYNPIMTDSQAYVLPEQERTASSKKIIADVAAIHNNQQSIKMIDKESLGPDQQYSMTNEWPDGYEFYDEASRPVSEKIVGNTN